METISRKTTLPPKTTGNRYYDTITAAGGQHSPTTPKRPEEWTQWKINQHTVSFNGNSSTSGSAPEGKEYNYNETVTIPVSDSLKRAGYTYEGWNNQQSGEGKAYAAHDTFSMPDSDVVLYAQWKAMPTFKVMYT